MVVPVPPCATVSVPVSVERERQVPEIEKQPVATLIPAPNDDVADPVTSSLMAVVDPVAESSVKMDEVVVAKVVSEEVEKYNFELIALKLNGEFVRDPSERVNCGSVDDASCSVQRGVVVPSPKYPFPAAAVVYAEFVTAPKAVPDERYWISEPVPAGYAPEVRQVLPIAKHPVERLIPAPKDEVAEPVTSSLMAVVEPVEALSERIDEVVVAKVVGDEVEKYRDELMALRLNGELVSDASERVSCGAVELATLSAQRGVVVPIPKTGLVTPFT